MNPDQLASTEIFFLKIKKDMKLIVSCSHDCHFQGTVKPVLRCHSKTDKTKILKTNGSLMKVKSIAECSLGAFCNTFDLH